MKNLYDHEKRYMSLGFELPDSLIYTILFKFPFVIDDDLFDCNLRDFSNLPSTPESHKSGYGARTYPRSREVVIGTVRTGPIHNGQPLHTRSRPLGEWTINSYFHLHFSENRVSERSQLAKEQVNKPNKIDNQNL